VLTISGFVHVPGSAHTHSVPIIRGTVAAAIELRGHLNAVAYDVKAPAEVFIGALEHCAKVRLLSEAVESVTWYGLCNQVVS
jgi:hypothetical protein